MLIKIASAAWLATMAMAEVLEPPPPVDYLAWAESNVVFSERTSPLPGPYNRALFPYFDEPLRALSPDDPCRIVTFVSSAQIGKSTLATIFTGGSLDMDPSDFLYVHPTEDFARKWSKMRLAPMLADTPCLRAIFPQKPRDGLDSVFYKERRDGRGAIVTSGANSPNSLSGITVKRQVQDELSKWEPNVAGDPEAQADDRSRAHEFAKILKVSTPLVLPGCKITAAFESGSQEHYYVPCPHCDAMQVLEWDNMLAALDLDRPEDAHFTCIACGAAIEEHHRSAMLARAEWRAHNPDAARHHRSFWIWSAYSYLQSWERIAREWLRSRGHADSEQTFLNQTAGRAFKAQSEAPPWEILRDRAAAAPIRVGLVPATALKLFMGIDCQGDRVEWQVVGYGRNRRRDVIAYGVVPGHISEKTTHARLDDVLAQTFPADNGQRVGIERAAIDGNAYTEDVWDWAKRFPHARLIMVRGVGQDGAASLQRVQREINPRTGKKLKYARRFYNFGTSARKMGLYRDLAKDDPLAYRYIGLPQGLPDEYFQQLTAERRVAHRRHGFVVYRWEKDEGQANEALDTFLQADAAAENWGIRTLPDSTWDRLEAERAIVADVQGDIEDLLGAPAAPFVKPVSPPPARKRRVLSEGI
ncbi:MAG: terminase [Xanthobacteraceae bacterium]|nr:MAG: terminase [Xanthobacteraceae bacterium]